MTKEIKELVESLKATIAAQNEILKQLCGVIDKLSNPPYTLAPSIPPLNTLPQPLYQPFVQPQTVPYPPDRNPLGDVWCVNSQQSPKQNTMQSEG
jgi:hypothetical protein